MKMVIRELIADLKEQEKIHKHSYSIIIGDLNASPFDEELIQKDAFNDKNAAVIAEMGRAAKNAMLV